MPRSSARGLTPSIWTQPPPPPKQRALGREEIVAAAIDLADEAGADALTMKAVATRLGSYSPMALYRYVGNKDGLIDLMLDAATAEVPVPAEPSGDWRGDLHAVATATRQMIGRHPWYALLTHARPPAGPHQMRRLEFMLAVLTGEGAELSDAMTYAALLDRHVLGEGSQRNEETRFAELHGLADSSAFLAAMAPIRDLAAADGRFPNLARWLSHPAGPPPEDQFDLGLTFLLDGISARLVP
jgi:AcrR family transcriptional regulator